MIRFYTIFNACCILYIHFHSFVYAYEVGWREFILVIDFTTNYCGAYWSAGRFQSSVEDNTVKAVSPLDEQCRLHDRAYARGDNRDKADVEFFDGTTNLGLRGKLYGNLVLHGNRVLRKMGNFLAMGGALEGTPYDPYSQATNKNTNKNVDSKGPQVPANPSIPKTNLRGDMTQVVYDPQPDQPTASGFNQVMKKDVDSQSQPMAGGFYSGLPLDSNYYGRRKFLKFNKKFKKFEYG